MMTRAAFLKYFQTRMDSLYEITSKAQEEYAAASNTFDNFDRLSQDLGIDRKKVLWVYAKKHLDGIRTYLNNPERASREPIGGRIGDVIIYMMLLDAMIADEANRDEDPAANQGYMSQPISDMLDSLSRNNR